MCKEIQQMENKLVGFEMENRILNAKMIKMTTFLTTLGHSRAKIEEVVQDTDTDDGVMPANGGGESST